MTSIQNLGAMLAALYAVLADANSGSLGDIFRSSSGA
jgi:hypothetical protein